MDHVARKPVKVKVQDKRKRARRDEAPTAPPADEARSETGPAAFSSEAEAAIDSTAPAAVSEESSAAPAPDYLDDLRRLQAEFDNYRKRMMKEQSAMAARASERLLERLLPVLDDFERALEHSADAGVELVFKHFVDALAREGLEEVPAEGHPFDPMLHEAVDMQDDPQVDAPMVRNVFRKGYRAGGRLLRPAMVVVARPPEHLSSEPDEAVDSEVEQEA